VTTYNFIICSDCNIKFLAISEHFYKNKKGKFGFQQRCKKCAAVHSKEWRSKNKNKMKIYGKKWRNKNKEKEVKRKKVWYDNNKNKIAIQQKEYREVNCRKIKLQQKKWRKNNKESLKIHNDNRRLLKLVGDEGITAQEWADKITEYNGRCVYCNVVLEENVQFKYNPNGISKDHVISLDRDGRHEINNIVLCCILCNTKKGNKVNWVIA